MDGNGSEHLDFQSEGNDHGVLAHVHGIRRPRLFVDVQTVRITIHRVFLLFMVDLLFILDFSERAVFPVGGFGSSRSSGRLDQKGHIVFLLYRVCLPETRVP